MRKLKVKFKQSKKNKQFYWDVVASNGKKIATSGETFKTKLSCSKSFYKLFVAMRTDGGLIITEEW
jgi:uncharacterized protein YegP (UPF0339 family)